jgi:hypothetical protein
MKMERFNICTRTILFDGCKNANIGSLYARDGASAQACGRPSLFVYRSIPL